MAIAKTKTAHDIQVRWMVRRDMPEVLAIENRSFDKPWCEEQFLDVLRRRECIGLVAEEKDIIHGFLLYELQKTSLQILRFAVATNDREQSVGEAIFKKMKDKLSQQRRSELKLNVPESFLEIQLFLRAQGFVAIDIVKQDDQEDEYSFSYLLNECKDAK